MEGLAHPVLAVSSHACVLQNTLDSCVTLLSIVVTLFPVKMEERVLLL